MIRRLRGAFAFLTRLPVRGPLDDVGRAALFFPLVGTTLGLLGAAVGQLGAQALPTSCAAVLVVAAHVLATGALHLDGVADTADGFGGGHTRDDVLRIMRDHAVGAYGALALVLVVAARIVAIEALLSRGHLIGLVIAPTLGRLAMVWQPRLLPYARPQGLGAAMRVDTLSLVGATLFVVAWVPWRAVLAAVACTVVATRICGRRIGGFTGDTLGALNETVEVAVLMLFAAAP